MKNILLASVSAAALALASTAALADDNSVFIDQTGSYNNATISQTGNNNTAGTSGAALQQNGNGTSSSEANNLTINQTGNNDVVSADGSTVGIQNGNTN